MWVRQSALREKEFFQISTRHQSNANRDKSSSLRTAVCCDEGFKPLPNKVGLVNCFAAHPRRMKGNREKNRNYFSRLFETISRFFHFLDSNEEKKCSKLIVFSFSCVSRKLSKFREREKQTILAACV